MDKNFEKGQYVVYPAHGVGVVEGVEKQEIAGTNIKVIVIFFEKDKMTLRLPLNKFTAEKLRTLCSKEEMAEAIDLLRIPTRIKKMMWSRRAQEYESKINSGITVSIAQVVRDLHRTATQPEHSYSERQIYQAAIDRLMREYAAIAKIDEIQAMNEIEKALAA